MSTVLGTLAATEQAVKFGWSPQRGSHTERRFRGSFNNIRNTCQQYINWGWTVEVAQQLGDIWELTATIGKDDYSGSGIVGNEITTQWELMPNQVEKDLLSSSVGSVTGLTAAQAGFLKKLMNGKVDETDYTADPGYPGADTNFDQLCLCVIAGTKSHTIYAPVLRKTQLIYPWYNIANSYTNIGCVYSTSKLLSSEAVPARVANIIGYINTSAAGTRADGVSTYFGWLKCHPTLNVSVGDKEQLSQEWQWGEWATALYTTVT